jgi:glyoxalase family protein
VKLEGIHHVTAITADAPRNVDFYARLLGLRLVKKTVNFDAPDVYHLYYGDELGHPGSVMTFFEFPGAAPGRAGAGMIHRVAWRVRAAAALDFWADRLAAEGVAVERSGDALRFSDPEGLELELVVRATDEQPLAARFPGVPEEHALVGFDGVHAYASRPEASAALLAETLGFAQTDEGWQVRGNERSSAYRYDAAPAGRAIQGAGTVHHVAFASRDDDHEAWRRAVADAGAHVTPVIDHDYFRSIYFREPSRVLFGFTLDEPAETLGEALKLPTQHEHLRERLGRTLTPLESPRAQSRT